MHLMRHMSVRMAGALLMLAATSCSTPYKQPVLVAAQGKPEFPGIAQLLTPSAEVDVLMVHGMCTHDATWARESLTTLSTQLGDKSPPDIRSEVVPGTKIQIFRTDIVASAGNVRATALLWSPVTADLKSTLCYDQSDKSSMCRQSPNPAPPYPYDRAALNKGLKDSLLDDCLADALIYQGKSRDAISEQMQAAIVAAFKVSAPQPRPSGPLIVVTDSLGSKITFDAFFRLAASSPAGAARDAAASAIDRIAIVFMRANQLPILALADRSVSPSAALTVDRFPADPVGAVLSLKRGARAAMVNTNQVVAFTDPNDLLSYILVPTAFAKGGSYDVIDVVVSNQPTYFGLLERPDLAHTSYSINPVVVRMIACGMPRAPGCGKD